MSCINYSGSCRAGTQIDQMQKMGLFTGNRMGWFSALFTLPFVGYLLFIKKYLRKDL